MQLTPGVIVGGKYRIERPLARGGMGSVWVARHAQLGSTVAIKFLDASFAASAAHRARFEREARAAANLKSPHVVHVSDYGFEADAPFLVMELLEGEDLGQRLHRIGRMNLRDTAKVLAQVGKALRKAHEAGFAHRDLKPANLFIARIDDEEIVKVLDFGIAKESNSVLGDATRTGEVMGSPHYMSPEQVRAEKDLDYRTDLWSLGIILYRMLVGELPFPGDQLGPVLAKILTDPIPVPSRAAPDLSPSIDAYFARALARDKTQRFQSINEMVDAFHAAIGGKDAFPSVSMSLGTGPVAPAPGPPLAGGTALWEPPAPNAGRLSGSGPITGAPIAQSGPITGSGPQMIAASQTGPLTAGGLVSTGPQPKPKGAGVAIAVVVALFALAGAATGVFLVMRSPSDGTATAPAATSEATASSAPTVTPQAPAVTPTVDPSASATAAATASASVAAATSAAPTTKTTATKPKTTGTAAPAKTKEKWF